MFVKMSFNPDPSKQAQEIILVEKLRKFVTFPYVLITALSAIPISKAPWHIYWCSICFWQIFESDYYQGK